MGEVGKERGEEQQGENDHRCADQGAHGCSRAGLVVDAGAREASGHRVCAGERRADVGRAQGDELLVRVDPRSLPRRDHGPDGKALDVGDHRDHRRRWGEVDPHVPVVRRDGERWQTTGDQADGRDPCRAVQVPSPDDDHRARSYQQRAQPGDQLPVAQAETQRAHQELGEGYSQASHQPQRHNAAHAHDRRRRVHLAEVRDELTKALHRIPAAVFGNAREGVQLADDDQQRGCVDEADDHRMAQEIDDAAHLPEPEQPEKDAGLQAENGRDAQVGLVVKRGVLAHRGRDHQRCHRNGSHHQVPGGTQNRVDHHGDQARVQARLGGETRQEGIGDGLRDGDDADHQP